MTMVHLPLLERGKPLRNSPHDGLNEIFSTHDNGLILVVHEMNIAMHDSRQRYLQLGIISSRDQKVTFSRGDVYLPTIRFVWSRDNCDIKYKRGGIILPIAEGQRYAFLEVPLGTDYSRTLFIGTTEVEKWFAEQNKFPYLRGDLFRELDYPMGDGENFSLDLCLA